MMPLRVRIRQFRQVPRRAGGVIAIPAPPDNDFSPFRPQAPAPLCQFPLLDHLARTVEDDQHPAAIGAAVPLGVARGRLPVGEPVPARTAA